MKITLRGCNGKKREIPLEELIEKFWDDEQHNPISVEMSTSTCDEEIYAEMNIMPEEKGYFPCISLESRNEKIGKNARWFELETPNLDSPFVVGKMYAGNTETETDEWLVRIVDGFRGFSDDSPRTIYVDNRLANIQDANGNYKNAQYKWFAATESQYYDNFSYQGFATRLTENSNGKIDYISDTIVSKDEAIINHVADMFDGMGYVATTGYFDQKDDIESGESDSLTGYYYVEI